jgi:RNA polymerase sigma-70 factor (ECF subfamily)
MPEPVVDGASEIPRIAEHLFRHEAGKLVSMLTATFGMGRLQLAEDVVQEAMIRALQTWPYSGIPENPAAWLMQTAKNRALDVLRREKRFHEKQPDMVSALDRPSAEVSPRFDDEIRDDRLRLIFACCHPSLPQDAQTALALKTLCGFGTAEIAGAFLTSEAAIAKRLTRARGKIAELGIPFEIPAGSELPERLDGVMKVIYFLFNEGYSATVGDRVIREELCDEAIRLAMLLAGHPVVDHPKLRALLALMLLNGARLPAREDSDGNILRLKDQDRALWDRRMIGHGLLHLREAVAGDDLSEYHLQAGIAACHCTAEGDDSTDWKTILGYYDRWLALSDSPVVALNRAVALSRVEGADAGMRALEEISNRGQLDSYYLFHAVLGDFEQQRQRLDAAAGHFERALQLTEVKSEQVFLTERLRDCGR